MSKVKATKNIDELLSSSEEEVQKKKTSKTAAKAKKVVESDESSEESVEFLKKKTERKGSNSKKANAATAKKPVKKVESSDDDSSSEEVVKKAPVKKAAPAKKVESSDDDSSSEEVVKKAPVKKVAPAKKVESSDDDSSSEEVVKKAPVKKAAPAKKVESSDDDSSSEEVVKKAPVKKAAPAKKVESSDEESSEEEVVTKKAAPAKKAESSDEEESIEFKPQPKVAHAEPESDCTELFVKNLPWSADENKLYEFFGNYGTVNNVKVLYDKMTGKARGLAFVEFSSRDEAKKAITDAANLMIDGRNLQVSFSDQKPQGNNNNGFQRQGGFGGNQGGYGGNQGGFQKKNFDGERFTAFVGNLGFKTTEAAVGAFFKDCGNVLDVRIAKNPEDGRSKGYAHVDFDSNEAVQNAMKKAGQSLDGRDVRVDASTPRQGGGDSKFFLFYLFSY
jgi:nucleolin